MLNRNEILNRLVELEIVNVVGNDHLLNDSFTKKVAHKVANSNCIANYCLSYNNNSKKGVIPYAIGDSVIINKFDGTTVQPLADSVEFKQSVYQVDEILSYIEVNNTTLALNKEGLEEVLASHLAKCLVKSLNKIALDLIKAKKGTVQTIENVSATAYVSRDIISAVARICLYNPSGSAILCGAENIATIADISFDKKPNILGVDIIVCDGLDSVVILDESALAHIYNETMKIGIDTNSEFKKNKSLVTMSSEHGFAILDDSQVEIFQFA